MTGASPSELPRRPTWFFVVVGLALVALGGGTTLVASGADREPTALVAGNRPVNEGRSDPLDISAHNSPTLVQSPQHHQDVAVVNRIDSPGFSCALHRSSDGGATWRNVAIPFPAGEEQPPRCFGPDAAFGPDGTLYVSFVTLTGQGNIPSAAWVSSAPPDADELSTPLRAGGPSSFQLRLLADPGQPGRLYLSWLQALTAPAAFGFSAPGNPIVMARSDDGGATWGPPHRVSPPRRARSLAPTPGIGPVGQLYVLYLDLGDDELDYAGAHEGKGGEAHPGPWSLVLSRSTDGGRTWREAVVSDRLVPIERVIAFFPPYPTLAIAPQGERLYAGFHDAALGDADVSVWASKDAGATFGPPRRVNETAPRDGTAQYLPKLAVAPNGRLDVAYYDRRTDKQDVQNEVSLHSSYDGGARFGERLQISDRPFDSRVGFGAERGLPDLGSRLGLVSSDHRVLVAWADTRAGTTSSGKQDLAITTVSFRGSSPPSPVLRLAGVAAMTAGVVVVAAGLFRRWRPAGPQMVEVT